MNIMKRWAKGEYKQIWGAEAAYGDTFCSNTPMFIPLPGTSINFELRRPEMMTFEGKATEDSDGCGWACVGLGLRVDGIDYERSSPRRVLTGQTEIVHSVGLSLHLKKGLHNAELIFRVVRGSLGCVYRHPSWPAYLEAWY